jgi:hypothetical protein
VNPGDVLGHYRIVEPLGKGGMGEVFVAEDTKLHRRVALKILPSLFAADPDYRLRFEREAQAVAALNHPGIVTIHSVEEHGGRLLLTMELVEGQPLGEVIPKGGLPLERLLRIGIEVADAMAAAQARGITHRDLKPGNIMVTGAGRAKVLDFGLAKVREAQAAGPTDDLTRMSTSSGITGEGKIIGTVAYMSPEQAEGKPVDPRSDIFSLGVVLHEMATGDRPFKGDTNVSIISAILKDTPIPVTDTNPALPADLARIVRRCLAKDPERRYQTAVDLRNELEELKQDTASRIVTAVRPAPARRRLPLAAVVGGIAAIAAAIIAAVVMKQGGDPAPAAATTFTIDRLQRLTTTGSAFMAAIIGIAWSEQLRRAVPAIFAVQEGTLEERPDFPIATLFMPDGNLALFQRVQGKASIVTRSLKGGPPRPLIPPSPDHIFSAAVSRTGRVAISRGQSTSDVVLIMSKPEPK